MVCWEALTEFWGESNSKPARCGDIHCLPPAVLTGSMTARRMSDLISFSDYKKTWFLNKIPTVHENVNKKVRSHPKPHSEIIITKTPFYPFIHICGLPQWLSGKESACNAGDVGSTPGLGTFSGRRHGKPLQYSCLENPMDRRAWWAIAHRVTKSQTRLSEWAHAHTHIHVRI